MAPGLLSPIAFSLFGILVEVLLLLFVYGVSRDLGASVAATLAGVWLAVAADNVRAYRAIDRLAEGIWGLLWTLLLFALVVVAAAEWSRFGESFWFVVAYGSLVLASVPSWGFRARILE